MNRKLLKVLDEIDKTEEKIAEWQGHLAALHEQRVQLEEKEIIRGIRAMNLGSRELLAVLDGICTGELTLASAPDGMGRAGGTYGQAVAGVASGTYGQTAAGTAGNSPQPGMAASGDGLEIPPAMETPDSRDAGNSPGMPVPSAAAGTDGTE